MTTEVRVKEFEIVQQEWAVTNKIPHAYELFQLNNGNYETVVRQVGTGKKAVYFALTNKRVDLNGMVEDIIARLAEAVAGMVEVEVRTGREAVGGGMGHYDYATVTRLTGWTVLNENQVEAVLTLKRIMLEKAKAERLNKLAKKALEADYKKKLAEITKF